MMDSTIATTVATTWFNIWIAQPPLTKFLDITILAGLLGFILFSVAKFMKVLHLTPKSISNKDTTIKFNDNDVDLGTMELELHNHKIFRLLTNAETMQYYHKEGSFTNKDIINFAFLQKCVFVAFEEELTSFIKEVEKRKGENLADFPEILNNIIKRYQDEALNIRVQLLDGSIIHGIPSVYINKFNNWNSEHMSMCKKGINETLVDTYYLNWSIRASTCLEYLYMIINMIIHDAESTLESMNGDLSKCIDEMVHSEVHVIC